MSVVWLTLAGGAGALVRYAAGLRFRHAPVLTIVVVNIAGSFLAGLITGLVLGAAVPTTVRTVAGTGFCGGFTTFSTASADAAAQVRAGRAGVALWQLVGTAAGCLAAAALGIALGGG